MNRSKLFFFYSETSVHLVQNECYKRTFRPLHLQTFDNNMGWFGGHPSVVSPVTEVSTESTHQQYLEDLPPKFEDTAPTQSPSSTSLLATLQSLGREDFTVENYISMPCFREALLTGFQSMGVLGVVTFLIHKNPSRSLNWGVSGFFLGSVVGWEQCRSIRRRSFQTVEAAKQAKQEKIQKKIGESVATDSLFDKFNEVQSKT